MRALITRFFSIVALIVVSHSSLALVVVVGKGNTVDSLSKTQVIDIYMGRYNTFPNGVVAKPLDRTTGSNEKQQFYQLLVNKSEEKINAYWARLLFSGRASPPSNYPSNDQMLDELRRSDKAIGYVLESEVDDSLKVVYRFEE